MGLAGRLQQERAAGFAQNLPDSPALGMAVRVSRPAVPELGTTQLLLREKWLLLEAILLYFNRIFIRVKYSEVIRMQMRVFVTQQKVFVSVVGMF